MKSHEPQKQTISDKQKNIKRTYVKDYKLPNGSTYTGQIVNGKFDGQGILKYNNKQRYEGCFIKGVKNGNGKYYYQNGEFYIGNWVNNKKQGNGIYFYDNNKRYDGQFKNNMKHGKGKILQQNGNYFEGQFQQNHRKNGGIYFDAARNKNFKVLSKDGQQLNLQEIIQPSSVVQGKFFQDQTQLNQNFNQNTSPQQVVKQIIGIYSQVNDDKNTMKLEETENTCKSLYNQNNYQVKEQNNRILLSPTQQQTNFLYIKSQNLRSKKRLWQIEDVCQWLQQIQFADFLTQFRYQNITGFSLLKLEEKDLEELNIVNKEDRTVLLRQISFLKLYFKTQSLKDNLLKYKQNQIDLQLIKTLAQQEMDSNNKSRNKNKIQSRQFAVQQQQIIENKQEYQSQCVKINQINKEQRQKFQTYDLKGQEESQGSEDSSTSESQQDQKNKRKPNQQSIQFLDLRNKKKTKINNKKRRLTLQRKIENYMKLKKVRTNQIIPLQQIQLLKTIGKGSYGEVFLASWMGQEVAVKLYTKRRGFRNRHVVHFLQQAQITSKVLHPNIVLYMGMLVYDNEYAIVMQYLSNGSLFDYLHIQGHKPTTLNILHICQNISYGMAYLHGKNILHCDLKSSNLLFDQNYTIKIADFGLSQFKVLKNKKDNKKAVRKGTPQWMAPEIMRGGEYQESSDVYSFGMILWQLMFCQIPFRELTQKQIIQKVGITQTTNIILPEYPNNILIQIFKRCTHKIPMERPSFKQIATLLDAEQVEIKKKLFNSQNGMNKN